jgi:integrase
LEDGGFTLTGKVKGGDYVDREVRSSLLKEALLDYLSFSGRLEALKTNSPLWTRHDRAGSPGAALTSHAFAKNLKRYASEAGIGNVHLHQTRHSFARIVAEETGSLIDTQDALGHRNASTTRVYVQRIAVKRDKHSERITNRLRKRQ